ncbi:mCG65745 [Mus musculus]|nr:mCG65745 [Mus musculus]
MEELLDILLIKDTKSSRITWMVKTVPSWNVTMWHNHTSLEP